MTDKTRPRRIAVAFASLAAALFLGAAGELLGLCGPFTDVSDATFCPFVLEIFTLGITTGTTPTTYDPASAVSRLQMAAFLSRSVDGVLRRGGRRAALNQSWTTQEVQLLGLTVIGSNPNLPRSDGADVWVPNFGGATVSRVRGSDGRLLETWTGATSPTDVLPAGGSVFVSGKTTPGRLYRINPSLAAGAVTTLASTLGAGPLSMTLDGSRFWTANVGGGSVSIVTPGAVIPWTVTTVTTGFSAPVGIAFDGANVWVTDAGKFLKLDSNGAILQTVTVGAGPAYPVFDGTNFWVPNGATNSVSVVRASTGTVLATLTGNGLDLPSGTAFDGQRILVANTAGNSVSLWKAADLTPLGSLATGAATQPFGACSDGVNFWVTLSGPNQLARF